MRFGTRQPLKEEAPLSLEVVTIGGEKRSQKTTRSTTDEGPASASKKLAEKYTSRPGDRGRSSRSRNIPKKLVDDDKHSKAADTRRDNSGQRLSKSSSGTTSQKPKENQRRGRSRSASSHHSRKESTSDTKPIRRSRSKSRKSSMSPSNRSRSQSKSNDQAARVRKHSPSKSSDKSPKEAAPSSKERVASTSKSEASVISKHMDGAKPRTTSKTHSNRTKPPTSTTEVVSKSSERRPESPSPTTKSKKHVKGKQSSDKTRKGSKSSGTVGSKHKGVVSTQSRPTIDRVPTAMGYSSDDSVEALINERSRYSRYSIDPLEDEVKSLDDDDDVPESRSDDKYSGHTRYGHIEALWSESTEDAPQWRDERDDPPAMDTRIKKKANEISVSYSMGEATGVTTAQSGVESEWSESIVVENDSGLVDPIYTKPEKTIKSDKSDGSREKKYNVTAQVEAQKTLKKKQKTKGTVHGRNQPNAAAAEASAEHSRPSSSTEIATPSTPESAAPRSEQYRNGFLAELDGDRKEIQHPKRRMSSEADQPKKQSASGDTQNIAKENEVDSPSMANLWIRGLANMTKSSNASSASTPLFRMFNKSTASEESSVQKSNDELMAQVPTQNPPTAHPAEHLSETAKAQQPVEATRIPDRTVTIAHVDTSAEEVVELAWNGIVSNMETIDTPVSRAVSSAVDSSDDESQDSEGNDDESSIVADNSVRNEERRIDPPAATKPPPSSSADRESEQKRPGIKAWARKLLRKPNSHSSGANYDNNSHPNKEPATSESKKSRVKTHKHDPKPSFSELSSFLCVEESMDTYRYDGRSQNAPLPPKKPKHKKNTAGASRSKMKESTMERNAQGNTAQRRTAVKQKNARRASSEPKGTRTGWSPTKSGDPVDWTSPSESLPGSFDEIEKHRSLATKSTVSVSSRSSKPLGGKQTTKSSIRSTKSGRSSAQITEIDKLTMYSKSLITEDSDESGELNMKRCATSKSKRSLRKKKDAEMAQLDEYEDQLLLKDEPQLVQCLKYYYCGTAANVAGTAITSVDCKPKVYPSHDGAVDDAIMEQRMDDEDFGMTSPVDAKRHLEIREDDILHVESSESLVEAPEIALPRTPSVVMEVTDMTLHLDDDSEANRRDAALIRAQHKAENETLSITSIEFATSASSGAFSSQYGAASRSVASIETDDEDNGSVEYRVAKRRSGFLKTMLKKFRRIEV